MKSQVAIASMIVAPTVLVSFCALISQVAASQNPEFFTGASINGKPLEKLTQEYWQWFIGVASNQSTSS